MQSLCQLDLLQRLVCLVLQPAFLIGFRVVPALLQGVSQKLCRAHGIQPDALHRLAHPAALVPDVPQLIGRLLPGHSGPVLHGRPVHLFRARVRRSAVSGRLCPGVFLPQRLLFPQPVRHAGLLRRLLPCLLLLLLYRRRLGPQPVPGRQLHRHTLSSFTSSRRISRRP